VRPEFLAALRCALCHEPYRQDAYAGTDDRVLEGVLQCRCPRAAPIIDGVPRIMPSATVHTLVGEHADFYRRHPHLLPSGSAPRPGASVRTLHAFGDEWRRFPELLEVHQPIFDWYFEGPERIQWQGLRVLDAGCGMGRWLHFARTAGAQVVGVDVSAAIDVAAA